MRVEKSGIRYASFQELAEAKGIKKETKRNDEQLTKQKEKFLGTCKICKQPLIYVSGTNIVACQNPACKGYKHTSKNKDGEEKVYYTPVFRVLNDKSSEYAEYLFMED